jgi:thiamine pyrophosphate-dependent acetolactate synthase large subunit-like protein
MVGLARAFGLHAERLTRPDQLRPALERGRTARGPVLLDVALAS